jgi:hypothetical protein
MVATRSIGNDVTAEVGTLFPSNRVFVGWETARLFVSGLLDEHEPQVAAVH